MLECENERGRAGSEKVGETHMPLLKGDLPPDTWPYDNLTLYQNYSVFASYTDFLPKSRGWPLQA